MNVGFYTYIGYAIVWCIKLIIIPFGVSVAAGFVVYLLSKPQPRKQKKKRSQ